jgi:GH35 family endo-1,4-beta-xylanase
MLNLKLFFQLKKNDFVAKMEVVDTRTNETMKFYSDSSRTEHEAIQSAYNEAIMTFVEKILIVNDFNYAFSQNGVPAPHN